MRKFFSFVAAAFVALTMNAQAISVADAITEGMKLDSAATSEAEFVVEGFVINSQPFSLSYNNQIWYMADDAANEGKQEFQAYGCVAIEDADTLQVIDGDKVQLKGNLFKYYNKSAQKYVIEIKNGVASFVSKAEGDHSIKKETTQISVAEALEIGKGVELGKTTAETYEIVGYISAMAGKDGDFDKYGNQTYWITDSQSSTAASNADGAFEIYRGKASEEVFVGYKVSVKTAIKNYKQNDGTGLIESETNAPVTILEKSEAPTPEAINVATACEEALKLGDNEESTTTYAVSGYVAKVHDKGYNTQYGSLTFYMTDDPESTYGELTCYQTYMSEAEGTALAHGDRVLVIGKLMNNFYNDKNTPQIKQGKASVEWKQAIENIILTEKVNKVIVDGNVYIVRDGKLFNMQGAQVR